MEKSGYIKQLKRLIKKYHPDLCHDEHLESIYNEISVKLVNKLNELKSNENKVKNNIKTNEQDYAYYKLGIKFYKNIHPDKFYKSDSDGTFKTKTYNELVSVLNNIFLSFNLSEYYFQKIVLEYPKSIWLDDAKNKIELLKKLYKRYENMTVEENKTTNYSQFVNEMGLQIM